MNNNLDTQTWKKRLSDDSNAICLDVRTSNEHTESHIPNSRHIDICLLYTSPSPRDY